MSNMSFQEWHDDADMPTRDARGWYDAETGLRFDPEAKRTADNSRAQEARKIAKKLGGKALTGTAAQKAWGEDIRASTLAVLDEYLANLVLSNPAMQTAKYWIENRANCMDAEFFVEAFKPAFTSQLKKAQERLKGLTGRMRRNMSEGTSVMTDADLANADNALREARELIEIDEFEIKRYVKMSVALVSELNHIKEIELQRLAA